MSATVALVLAAGAGTRMRSEVPKVLHPIAGKSMLYHAIKAAAEVSQAVVTVVGHEADAVVSEINTIGDLINKPIYHTKQKSPLGTADAAAQGAVGAALSGLNPSSFLITYGDVPLLKSSTLADLIEAHHASEATVTIATFISDKPFGYGRIVRSADGYVQRIVEQCEATPMEALITEVNSGVYIVDAEFLVHNLPLIDSSNTKSEKYLTDIVGLAVKAGHVVTGQIVNDGSQLTGCNNQHELLAAREEFNRRIIFQHLTNGVRIDEPASTWIDSDVTIESDAVILPSTSLLGNTHIGAHSVIGPGSRLVDSYVGRHCSVSRSEIHSSHMSDHCEVGPFSYVRPETHLAPEVKLGAYVETKNITVGQGSKIPHLSYVGDATIGSGTNIGAGTIVANYDGHTKHHTVIGDGVRVGSNSTLVAPVTIGNGAYTGADAVVRSDVPPGALSISAGNSQRTIDNWVARNRPGTVSAEAVGTHLDKSEAAQQPTINTQSQEDV